MADPLAQLQQALADRYSIERELGAGGMATVYPAQDLKPHRKVALKVLRPEIAATLGAERFHCEIQIAPAFSAQISCRCGALVASSTSTGRCHEPTSAG